MTIISHLPCCLHKGIYAVHATIRPTQALCKLKTNRPHPPDYSTHRQTPSTDNESSLLCAALGKAEPLISTAACRKTGELGQTDKQTDGRTLPSALSPCFAKATWAIISRQCLYVSRSLPSYSLHFRVQ